MNHPVYLKAAAVQLPGGAATPLAPQTRWFVGPALAPSPPLSPRASKQATGVSARAAALAAQVWANESHSDGDSVGVYLGLALGCLEANLDYDKPGVPQDPRLFQSTVANAPSAWVAIALGLRGPSFTFVSGETSGGEALEQAFFALRDGEAVAALAGGLDHLPPALELLVDGAPCEGAALLLLSHEPSPTRLTGVLWSSGAARASPLLDLDLDPDAPTLWVGLQPLRGQPEPCPALAPGSQALVSPRCLGASVPAAVALAYQQLTERCLPQALIQCSVEGQTFWVGLRAAGR